MGRFAHEYSFVLGRTTSYINQLIVSDEKTFSLVRNIPNINADSQCTEVGVSLIPSNISKLIERTMGGGRFEEL